MTDTWQQLELAGFNLSDLRPPGVLVVPHRVELRDEQLIYAWFRGVVGRVDGVSVRSGPIGTTPWRTIAPTSDLLRQFLRIRDGNGVLKFAAKWGVLGLCEKHGLPSSHRARPAQAPFNDLGSMNGDLRRLC